MFEPPDDSLNQSKPLAVDVTAQPHMVMPATPPKPVVSSAPPVVESHDVPSVFRFNKAAFLITIAGLATVALIVSAGLLIANKDQKAAQSNLSNANSYGVESLQVNELHDEQQEGLKVKSLAVNGQLRANNTLVIAPSDAPADPTAGQIYFDKATNTPFYYNGTAFLTLAPTQPASYVGSLQGLNGDVTLTSGQGINVNNTTISNTGVLSLTGANGLTVSSPTGSVTVGLPTASSAGQCLLSSTGGAAFGACTAAGAIASGTSQTGGKFTIFDTTTDRITDSILTQSGTTSVTVAGTLNSTVGFQVGGLAASGTFLKGNGTNFVSGSLTASDLPSGSGSYIQNTTTQQPGSNFNISGSGTIGGTLTAGTALFRNNSDSTTAFQIQNAASMSLLTADSLNQRVKVGPAPVALLEFGARTDLTSGTYPWFIETADFNADGKRDMAVPNYMSHTVSVYLNATANGATTPSFNAKTDFATGLYPFSAAAADFNTDGKPDLVTANYSGNSISVLLNTTTNGAASPTFSAKTDFASGVLTGSVTTADFNADGKPDVAVSNQLSNNVSVFLNTTATGAATPTFAARADFPSANGPYWVSSADFNTDGKPDLVAANYNSGNLSVFLNTTATGAATPTFSAKTDFAAGSSPISVEPMDINADGKPDLVSANSASNTVSILLNTTATGAATASFSARTDFAASNTPSSVVSADFNADGKSDIAVANQSSNSLSIYLNTTASGASTPTLSAKFDRTGLPGIIGVAADDFNTDGKVDLAVTLYTSNKVSILLNTSGEAGKLVVVSGGSSELGLIVQGASGQSGDLMRFASSDGVTLAAFDSGGNLVLQGSLSATTVTATTITSPGAGTGSEHFGLLSVASGSYSLALGSGASATSTGAVAIGNSSSANGTYSIAIGVSTVANNSYSIVMGVGAQSTTNNQLVMGGSSGPITNAFIGNGVTNAAPTGFTLQATGGSGTNIAGASTTIAGGKGTGTGNGGNVNVQVAKPGATGATANTLATVASFSGVNGAALFQNSADSATAFQVQSAGGTTIMGIDTASGKIFSGIADGASAIGFTLNTPAYTTAGAKLLSVQNNGSERFSIDKNGHVKFTTAGATTVVNGANTTCTLDAGANDVRGKLTMVSVAGGAVSCTITFANAFGAAPYSVATPLSGTTAAPGLAPTTTAVVVTGPTAGVAGETFVYNYFNPE